MFSHEVLSELHVVTYLHEREMKSSKQKYIFCHDQRPDHHGHRSFELVTPLPPLLSLSLCLSLSLARSDEIHPFNSPTPKEGEPVSIPGRRGQFVNLETSDALDLSNALLNMHACM